MRARVCGVATCPAMELRGRAFCGPHLHFSAFSRDGKTRWLCVRCAAAAVRAGLAFHADADASYAAARSIGTPACFRCGAALTRPRPVRKDRRGRLPRPVLLRFMPGR